MTKEIHVPTATVFGMILVFGQALAELVEEPGFEGVFSFRAGYPVSQGLSSPRRSVEEVLLAR
ncbi:hypothetical protein D3C84_1222170 [compost metagenome]